EAGIKCIATDEEILLQSSTGGSHQRDEIVFCPCVARDGANEVSMVFRDTGISNAVSFRYANMPGDVAAESLAKDVNGILDAVKEHRGDHIVSIILDGENPWPYYPDGGKKFLTGVYSLLVSSNGVELVTIGDYLERHKHRVEIKELYSGSWINHDFKKWIGSEQKNKAWSYLERVRKDLFSFSKQDKRSLEELYISESSDWFWWYDEFGTELNFVFDDLFRMHLANIYKINGKKVPAFVEEPIYDKGLLTGAGDVPPIMIPPVIDGKITTDFEWVSAHVVKTRSLSMEMVRTDAVVEEIGYGMDRENLYIMVRPGKNFNKEERYTLQISSASPIRVLIEIPFGKKGKGMATAWDIEMSKEKNINFTTFMFDDVAEMKIPFARLGAEANDEVNFRINVKKNDDIVETWPTVGFFKIIAPGKA
ncbi:MAG TPA: hypothetical protein PKG81_02370, partial [Candidatus Omnitrophota bacterium]|nr:hypothetical protein [Candidatus Omnitrophota bacterium]